MAPNENENIYDVQGYIKAGMIVLHSEMYDHEDYNGSVYIPKLFVINPDQICALKEIKLKKDIPIKTQVKTKIYFINSEYEEVYESINEILDLLEQYNIGQVKCAEPQKLNELIIMKYIKLTNVAQNHPVKSVIIKKDDIETVRDYGATRSVTVKTSNGTTTWVVSETLDEIYAMLEGDELLGLDKTKKPLYD